MVLHGIMEALCAGDQAMHLFSPATVAMHGLLVPIVGVTSMIYQPPHVVLVGFGSWWGLGQNTLDELASFLAPPQIMEDHQMDQPVHIALAQSGSLWLGLISGLGVSWCLHKHMALEPNVNKWQCHQPLVQLQRGWSGPQWHTCILNHMLQPQPLTL